MTDKDRQQVYPEGFPFDTSPRYLIRNRDAIYESALPATGER